MLRMIYNDENIHEIYRKCPILLMCSEIKFNRDNVDKFELKNTFFLYVEFAFFFLQNPYQIFLSNFIEKREERHFRIFIATFGRQLCRA